MSKRETWSSRTGFILAAVGSAIGLGNIWRFPYMVYENGGGAFLIPYFVAMLAAGIPFIILEFGLGHRFRGSAPKIFASISRRMEWLGWWQVLVAAVISTYYVVVISWAVNYFLLSFSLGWGDAPKDFFFGSFLGLTDSPLTMGGVNLPVFWGVVGAWLVTYVAVFTGVARRGGAGQQDLHAGALRARAGLHRARADAARCGRGAGMALPSRLFGAAGLFRLGRRLRPDLLQPVHRLRHHAGLFQLSAFAFGHSPTTAA